ncbi:MAG: ABC transporter permease [Terracidiphilus sp.]
MSIRRFFRREHSDAEVRAEMHAYLEEEIADNIARGISPQEARRQASVKLGSQQRVRETLWQQNTWQGLAKLGLDLRYAMRTLARTPGFSLIAVLVMALCIGAATSLFTIVRSVLLRPLPFRDPDQLVMLYEHWRAAAANADGFNYNVVAPGDFYDWRSQTNGFEDMAIWRYAQFNLTGARGELPEVLNAGIGSWNLFPLLGVHPVYGRNFTEREDHPGNTVVMLTWSLFERRFAADPSIVGRQIHLDGKPFTVVGVLPPSFLYPEARMQLWVPYQALVSAEFLKHHDYHQSFVVARLKPGVPLASAVSQVDALQYREHLAYPGAPVAEDAVARTMNDDLARNVKKPLIVLMSAVGCMLLIGCLNVANLLIARGASRQREIAIRSALGAQRSTLIRGQMMESLIICAAGGLGGLLLSSAGTRWLAHSWKDLPTAQGVHLDASVLLFTSALVFAAAVLAGLLPALSATGRTVLKALQTSARTGNTGASRTALRKILLTIEIAVTVVLLIAAGLLLKSFMNLRSTGVGSVTDDVLTLNYNLPDKKYTTPARLVAFNEALLSRLRAMPGVRAVALGSVLPGGGYGGDDIFSVKEHPPLKQGEELPDAMTRIADPGYFSALQIPLLRGRFFASDDRLDRADKIIISRALAQRYFAGEDPIGKHIHVPAYNDKMDYEIVGVVGDTLWRVDQPVKPMMYYPVLGGADNGFALAVHTAGDPLAFAVPVQKQIAALDPELPVTDVLTLDQIIGESLGNASLTAAMVLAFAVLSLLLASVGLYGVLSYLMTQRTTELGIRIALGAQRQQVLRLMLIDGLRPALLGLAVGLVAGLATTRIFTSMLYGTKALDPMVIGSVVMTLLAVAVIACLVPAWRASRLDPMQALRME